MTLAKRALRNISATWFGLAVQGVVSFLLSPFILHHLGDEAFSVWILIFALTGYFGLLDLGIRSSIVRYTARFLASGDRQQLSTYLSTSLAFYGAVAGVVLCLTILGCFHLPSLFKIPVSLLSVARVLFLLSGIGVALTFPFSVFAGVLEGLQKFAWLHLSQIAITLLRAVLIVLAIIHSGGLLAIGAITVIVNLLGYLFFTWLAIRHLRVSLNMKRVDIRAFQKMAGYGVFAFGILAAEKLRLQSDAMVIGAFLPATAITLFSIGSKLVEYSSYAVRSMAQIFTPMSSELQALGDKRRLQRVFVAGNQACALIMFPLCVVLVMLGKPIIEAWVGGRYVPAYSVLVVLIIPRTLYAAQATSTKLLLGMGRHRVLASVLLLEGAANLILSLLLVRRFGILGVALGTAIPMALTSVLFLPHHVCHILDLPLSTFLARAYKLPVLLCIPMAGVLGFIAHEFPSSSYIAVMMQVGTGALVYGTMLVWSVWNRAETRPRSWQAFAQLLGS